LGVTQFLMGEGHLSFKIGPPNGLTAAPVLAGVGEHSCGKDEVVCDCNYLGWRVWCICSISEGYGIFDLVEKSFNGLVGILVCLHTSIIGLEVGGGETAVRCVQMC
jgi:hypothetical protein